MFGTMLLIAAIQAAPVPPSPPAPPAPEKKVVREIVIREGDKEEVIRLPDGAGEQRRIVIREGDGKPGEKREITVIRRHGEGEHRAAHLAHCEGGQKFETEAEGTAEKGEKNRTRIVLCTRDAKGGASHAEALERAAKRIADDKAMPAEVRARVLASLTAEIARLKAGK